MRGHLEVFLIHRLFVVTVNYRKVLGVWGKKGEKKP